MCDVTVTRAVSSFRTLLGGQLMSASKSTSTPVICTVECQQENTAVHPGGRTTQSPTARVRSTHHTDARGRSAPRRRRRRMRLVRCLLYALIPEGAGRAGGGVSVALVVKYRVRVCPGDTSILSVGCSRVSERHFHVHTVRPIHRLYSLLATRRPPPRRQAWSPPPPSTPRSVTGSW